MREQHDADRAPTAARDPEAALEPADAGGASGAGGLSAVSEGAADPAVERIDGPSEEPVVARRVVVWRRLEEGDARTPGSELAPESEHLEARVVEVGIAASLFAELEELARERDALRAPLARASARYEPAGVVFTLGGMGLVGVWLDYLPAVALPLGASLLVLGAALGVFTKSRARRALGEADRRWRASPSREVLERIEASLGARWERFAARLRDETGFRVDVRVAGSHEAERLVSLDPVRLAHPDTWRPDAAAREVRYGWAYADGRVVEKRAELEEESATGA